MKNPNLDTTELVLKNLGKKHFRNNAYTVNNRPRNPQRKVIIALALGIGLLLMVQSEKAFFITGLILFGLCAAEWISTTLFPIKNFGSQALTALYLYIFGVAIFVVIASWNLKFFTPIVLTIAVADIFAQFSGKLFRKMTGIIRPVLRSVPSKSRAGLIGAMIFGGLFYFALSHFFTKSYIFLPWWAGTIIAFGAQVGDILNSYLKRRMNFKDWNITSYVMLWEHGGFIDRLCAYPTGMITALIVTLIFQVV